jgi:hypothetical protein
MPSEAPTASCNALPVRREISIVVLAAEGEVPDGDLGERK